MATSGTPTAGWPSPTTGALPLPLCCAAPLQLCCPAAALHYMWLAALDCATMRLMRSGTVTKPSAVQLSQPPRPSQEHHCRPALPTACLPACRGALTHGNNIATLGMCYAKVRWCLAALSGAKPASRASSVGYQLRLPAQNGQLSGVPGMLCSCRPPRWTPPMPPASSTTASTRQAGRGRAVKAWREGGADHTSG